MSGAMEKHPEDVREPKEREEERPRVKVVDRRRVRPETAPGGPGSPEGEAPAAVSEPPAAVSEPPAAEGHGPAAEGDVAAEPGPAEVEAVRAEVEEARRQAAEYRDHLQRLQAEFENYRKRVLKEQTRAVERAAEPLVRRLLEVLDEFELALMAAEDRPDFDRFLHGVELVYAKLLEALKAEGLERIEALGRPFDPAEHEALMQAGEGDGEPVVADVLRPGYRFRGQVIRPAGVKVTRS
ncbi:MAG TPA: nucleotide exchange factor GrpE [Actinomycetota bacterium]|nr:nucleotide exchange factor GrpE [Actinomycetota bacterium]